jgi:hypothetical protein
MPYFCAKKRIFFQNRKYHFFTNKNRHVMDIKAAIIAQFPKRKMSPDSILLRYQAAPPVLAITLLAYACCHPSVNIAKKMDDITENDVIIALAPIVNHAH